MTVVEYYRGRTCVFDETGGRRTTYRGPPIGKRAKRAAFYNRERVWRKSRQATRALGYSLLQCLATPNVNWWVLK